LKNLVINEGLQNCLPDVKTFEECLDVYRQFYTDEQMSQVGLIALRINKNG